MPRFRHLGVAACGALALSALGLAADIAPAAAATTVTTVDDELLVDGDCSLREALEARNTAMAYDACLPSDVIELPPGDYPVQFPLDVEAGVRLQGAGSDQTELVCTSVVTCIVHDATGEALVVAGLSMVDTQGAFVASLSGAGPLTVGQSVLDGSDAEAIVTDDGPVTLVQTAVTGYATVGIESTTGPVQVERSTLAAPANHGVSSTAGDVWLLRSTVEGHLGSAVVSLAAAVDVEHSAIVGNGDAAVATNGGPLSVVRSTVSGNAGDALTTLTGEITARWSTIAGNGGLAVDPGAGSADLQGVILANPGADCAGPLTSSGWNLADDGSCGAVLTDPTDQVGVDPLLGPLGGGPTPAHRPSVGSPAIDAGGTCPANDQWDQTTPVDGDGDGDAACDVGALEAPAVQVLPPDPGPGTPEPTDPGGVDRPVPGRPSFTG